MSTLLDRIQDSIDRARIPEPTPASSSEASPDEPSQERPLRLTDRIALSIAKASRDPVPAPAPSPSVADVQTPSGFLQPTIDVARNVGQRIAQSGQDVIDTATALTGRGPFPGQTIPEKLVRSVLAIPGALATPVLAPVGEASAKAAEGLGVGQAGQDIARLVSEIAASVGIPFTAGRLPQTNSLAQNLLRATGLGPPRAESPPTREPASVLPPEPVPKGAVSEAAAHTIPPELQDVIGGDAVAFLRPPAVEGTIPTAGEQAVAGLDLQAFANARRLGFFRGEDGTEVVFKKASFTPEALRRLDQQGKLAEIVNGPGTAPKPLSPTTAVTARTPEGTEIRTVLTDTPEQTQAAITAQPPSTTVEVAPAAEAAPNIIQERMQAIKQNVEDARTTLPTGKTFVRDETGKIISTGAAKSIREQLAPLFPELNDLPNVGPKQIIEAIDKDRGNKLYLQIQDAVTHQLELEKASPSGVVQRPSDFEEFSRAVDELAGQPGPVTPSRVSGNQLATALNARLQEIAPKLEPKVRQTVVSTATARFNRLGQALDAGVQDFLAEQGLTLNDETNRPFLNLLAQLESDGRADIGLVKDNQTTSLGPFQISKSVRKQFGLSESADLQQQTAVAERIVSTLRQRFGDDPAAVTTAYFSPRTAKLLFAKGPSSPQQSTVGGGAARGAEAIQESVPSSPQRPIDRLLESGQTVGGGAARGAEAIQEAASGQSDQFRDTLFSSPLVNPTLSLSAFKEANQAAAAFFREQKIPFDPSKGRLLFQLGDLLAQGKGNTPRLTKLFADVGLNLQEDLPRLILQEASEEKGSEAGKTLAELSRLSRSLEQRLSVTESPEPEAVGFFNSLQRVDRILRGLAVGALKTTTRNAGLGGQFGRLGLEDLSDAFGEVSARIVSSLTDTPRDATPLFDRLQREIPKLFSPLQNKEVITRILSGRDAERDRLFGTYFSDLESSVPKFTGSGPISGSVNRVLRGGEQASDAVNTLNRIQEFFFRRVAFGTKLEQLLNQRGLTGRLGEIDPALIQDGEINTAIDHALKLTFAERPPSGSLADLFIRATNKAPFLLTGPFPYPRFLYNALKFAYEFSPLPLLSQAERSAIASGDTAVLGRALTGTTLFLTAYELRKSEYAGEKFSDVKIPGSDQRKSLLPFNTFLPYLFLADLVVKAERGENVAPSIQKDAALGLLGSQLRAGGGKFLLDFVADGINAIGDPEAVSPGVGRSLSTYLGEILGRSTVPLSSIRDLLAEFNDQEAILRDRRSAPLLGPALSNVPILNEALPESRLPTRPGPILREEPFIRGQLTGVNRETNTPVEQELNRLGFRRNEISPSKGVPEADLAIARALGPVVDRVLVNLISSPEFTRLDDKERGVVISRTVKAIREAVVPSALQGVSDRAKFELLLRKLPERERELFRRRPDVQAVEQRITEQ